MAMIPRAQKYGYDHFDSINASGDLNNDGTVNILDIILCVNLILSTDFNSNADINADGTVNILDVVNLLNIILSGE